MIRERSLPSKSKLIIIKTKKINNKLKELAHHKDRYVNLYNEKLKTHNPPLFDENNCNYLNIDGRNNIF